ncbi:MAG: iron uptake porin [Spirulina sp. SIO3F2]|nr:iron uptake porin [Spirulina sp. SIO3F2]
MSNLRKAGCAVLGASLLLAQPLAVDAQTNTQEVLNQVRDYNRSRTIGQGVGAAQFSDVSPSDWAYQALDDLVRRYDCLKGYPNGTFRGNRALSRYEFAAGLNACMQQIERLIAETTADFVTRDDLETLRRLMQDFEAELAALGARVDALDSRVSFLEDNQFSTTVKLQGEVLFTQQQAFYDGSFDNPTDGDRLTEATSQPGDEITFGYRTRLKLVTSFNGEDQLGMRLGARNIQDFDVRNFTNEARLGYRGIQNIDLDQVFYKTPVGDRAKLQIWANGIDLDDLMSPLSPFASTGGGALSRFGQRNPFIYRGTGTDTAGIALNYKLSDDLSFDVGYTAGDAPTATKGVFSGDYSIPARLVFDNGDFAIAAAYVHGYSALSGIGHSTGSVASNVDVNSPTTHNNYGLEAHFDVSDSFFVGGWAGYSDAIVLGQGSAEVWNYALTLGFPDLGGDGNVLGFIIGREPYLAYTDGQLVSNNLLDLNGTNGRGDPDTSFHIEGFYKIKLSDSIEITPGLIWLTAPNNNDNNPDILMGAIRTRFKF